jgi:hypothetical protein
VDAGLGDRVVVVERDDRAPGRVRDRVDQLGEADLARLVGARERPDGLDVERHARAGEGLREVAPEPGGVVVGGVERHPRGGRVDGAEPVSDEGRLAPARGGADDRQAVRVDRGVEARDEVRPGNQARSGVRPAELGLDQRRSRERRHPTDIDATRGRSVKVAGKTFAIREPACAHGYTLRTCRGRASRT